MSSLYEIQNELLRIFANIEDADGEVTDEQYAQLLATQEDFKDKLGNYIKAIRSWEADAKACKDEESRIAANRKVRENRVAKLKNIMLQAVQQFGEVGKTGNKFVELPTTRIFTKSADSVIIDEDRITMFIEEFDRYIRELVGNGIITSGEEFDIHGVLDAINAVCIASRGEHFIPFTLSDISAIRLQIAGTWSIHDLFRSQPLLLEYMGSAVINTEVKCVTPKADWKKVIEITETSDEISKVTLASISTNQSIQFK